MKFCSARLGSAQSLVALSVSLAVILSTNMFVFASLAKAGAKSTKTLAQNQTDSSPGELRLSSVTATVTEQGVLLQWRTNSATDNVGFNVYRLKDGQRVRVNLEIIPGAVFAPRAQAKLNSGYSYSWFDRSGTADATYYIESVTLQGTAKTYGPLTPVTSKTVSDFPQTPETLNGESPNAAESRKSFEKYSPASEAQINSAQGALEDQWAIAAQSALKIAIKKDGWYRITQPQMMAAGFNPTVDIRNLRLFVDAQEVAINTSQRSGPFGSGEYIEFYGRGLDQPTTDTRIYYLIAGTTPGKRVRGQNQLDGNPIGPPAPTPTPPPAPGSSPPAPSGSPATTSGPVLNDPIFFSWVQRDLNVWSESLNAAKAPTTVEPNERENPRAANAQLKREQEQTAGASRSRRDDTASLANVAPVDPIATASRAINPIPSAPGSESARSLPPPQPGDPGPLPVPAKQPVASMTPRVLRLSQAVNGSARMRAAKLRKGAASKKRKRGRLRREPKVERNHAVVSAASVPPNFLYTSERKDRVVYFVSVLNGDAENFFGQVITFNSSNPISQAINTPNPDPTAAGTAQLEIALQGVNQVLHQISVEFNGEVVGSFSFFGLDPASGGHPVQVFNIDVSKLKNGANTIRFILPAGGDVSIVDYVKVTYPHLFSADAGALRFMLRGTQSVTVDGFSTPSTRLIDYTDPLNVGISRPPSTPSGSGFAITVPASDPPSKPPRLLYAIADGQFEQPAELSLNQPSTLNASSNAGSYLIISHKNFIPSMGPLLTQRHNQGFATSIVDVEDVYDEFAYGLHKPQALKDFLQHAATHWATPPRYLIFAGDASLDPRNYQGAGNFDLVPTKLVDATFNETASDDWLADFDNDGIADIPLGRLPVRTTAEANLVVSKIVNFTPPQPQNAVLIADEDPSHIFGFVEANDVFQALLSPSMNVQRINRGTGQSDAQVHTDIVNGFNQGAAVVSYSGHGNVDVWTGAALFTSADAMALTNSNKFSFVVVMDCLNGYFQDPTLLSLSEALLKAPNGGAVATFASSGLTIAQGQHDMGRELYTQLYSGPPMALGDAIKLAKGATFDIDVKRTWIFFGDPSMKIR